MRYEIQAEALVKRLGNTHARDGLGDTLALDGLGNMLALDGLGNMLARDRLGDTLALDGLDVQVPAGRVLGVLGPAGAGKTSAVRVLSTLLHPDGGRATVGGHDVTKDPARVRSLIGLTDRHITVDGTLTAVQHLTRCGRPPHRSEHQAAARAAELLERFDLTAVAAGPIAALPAGLRHRLDVAALLAARPAILLLDEPTAGLDPHRRSTVWDAVRELVADGSTALVTTRHPDEADQLADRVAVLDRGRVVAEGRPGELQRRVGGQILHVRPSVPADAEPVARILTELTGLAPARDTGTGLLTVVADDPMLLSALVRKLDAAGVTADELGLRRLTLEEILAALVPAYGTPAP